MKGNYQVLIFQVVFRGISNRSTSPSLPDIVTQVDEDEEIALTTVAFSAALPSSKASSTSVFQVYMWSLGLNLRM